MSTQKRVPTLRQVQHARSVILWHLDCAGEPLLEDTLAGSVMVRQPESGRESYRCAMEQLITDGVVKRYLDGPMWTLELLVPAEKRNDPEVGELPNPSWTDPKSVAEALADRPPTNPAPTPAPEVGGDPIAEWKKHGCLGWSSMLIQAIDTPGNYEATLDSGRVIEFRRVEPLSWSVVRLHGVRNLAEGERGVLDVQASAVRTTIEGRDVARAVAGSGGKPLVQRELASEEANFRGLQELIVDLLRANGEMGMLALAGAVMDLAEAKGLEYTGAALLSRVEAKLLVDGRIETSGAGAEWKWWFVPPPQPGAVKSRAMAAWFRSLAGRDLDDVTLLATTHARGGVPEDTSLRAALGAVFHARLGSAEERWEETRNIAMAWYRVRPEDGVPGRISPALAKVSERLKLGAEDLARTGKLPDSFRRLAEAPSATSTGDEPSGPTLH